MDGMKFCTSQPSYCVCYTCLKDLYLMQCIQCQGNYWIISQITHVNEYAALHCFEVAAWGIGHFGAILCKCHSCSRALEVQLPRKFQNCSIKSSELTMVAVLSVLNFPTDPSHSHGMKTLAVAVVAAAVFSVLRHLCEKGGHQNKTKVL